MHITKKKKSTWKFSILYNFTYITFCKRGNYGNSKNISGYQGLVAGRGKWIVLRGFKVSEMGTWMDPYNFTHLEKAMATYSSTLAWKIPRTEDPGRLQSKGSLSQTLLHDFTFTFPFMHWRGKWQPTPVFLPGDSQGWGSLVGCCLWGRTVGHDWGNLAAAAAALHIYPKDVQYQE